MLGILAIGALPRIWHLGSVPEAVHYDEADAALNAQALLHMPFQPIAAYIWGHNTSAYFYSMAALFRVAGHAVQVARLTSALYGIAGLFGIYLLGRALGGPAWGLCAAALLAVSAWGIHFSRFAECNIAAVTGLTFSAWAGTRAVRTARPFWFALAGICCGVTLLTYEGAMLPLLATGAVLATAVWRDRVRQRGTWPAQLLWPLGALVGALPFVVALHLDPAFVLWREHDISLFSVVPSWSGRLTALAHAARAYALMFTVEGDGMGNNNLPFQPLLDPVTGSCFLLGLGICLRHARRGPYLLLLLLLSGGLLSGILSSPRDAPSASRTLCALLPAMLIAGLPLLLLARYGASSLDRARGARPASGPSTRPSGGARSRGRIDLPRTAALLGMLFLLGIALIDNIHTYFVVFPRTYVAWWEMDGRLTILGRAIRPLLRQGMTVRVDPAVQGRRPTLLYTAGLNDMPRILAPSSVFQSYDPAMPVPLPLPAPGLALAVPPEDHALLADLRATFPQAHVLRLTPDFDLRNVQYSVVEVPRTAAERTVGLTVRFGGGRRDFQHVQGPIAWPPGARARAQVIMRGTLLVTTPVAPLHVQMRLSGVCAASIALGNGLPARWGAAPLTIHLAAGAYPLTIAGRGRCGPVLQLEWRQSGSHGPWRPLPPRELLSPGFALPSAR